MLRLSVLEVARTPPPRVTHAVAGVRSRLQKLSRRLVPSPVELVDLATGSWTTQALYVAARLGIADVLADGPLSAERIAERVGSDPGATYRLLRALADRSVFTEQRDGRFALTGLAEPLRSDHPRSVRPVVLMIGHPVGWANWGDLLMSVRTGLPGFETRHAASLFDYLEQDPGFAEVFNNAMDSYTGLEIEPVLGAVDFARFGTIVDVGGGHGSLLAAILARTPEALGILYDLDTATAGADRVLTEAGVRERCTVVAGSFFDSVPTGGDAYLLKHIVHDWSDEQAVAILQNVRSAMPPGGTLLLVEMVVPGRNVPHMSKWLDLEMLVQVTGRERTEDEFRTLLDRVGFELTRVVPTIGAVSVIEAAAV